MADQAFTFHCLDEVLQAAMLGDDSYATRNLYGNELSLIGPLAEYAFQVGRNGKSLPRTGTLPMTPSVQALTSASGDFQQWDTSLQPKAVEFSPVVRNGLGYGTPLWIAFQKRFERACIAAGFSTPIARAMACALGEMTDNVTKHSENVTSGMVGYRWTEGQIEYVVSDAGIGVLRSLRSCPDYAGLRDHAQALATALQPNESRLGRGSGHGTGFNYVFTSLLNLHGSLRFRSGDQAMILEGDDPELASAQLRQCPPFFQGFLLAVTCRRKNPSKVVDAPPSGLYS